LIQTEDSKAYELADKKFNELADKEAEKGLTVPMRVFMRKSLLNKSNSDYL
jgi:hypothetical protein